MNDEEFRAKVMGDVPISDILALTAQLYGLAKNKATTHEDFATLNAARKQLDRHNPPHLPKQ